MDINIEVIGDPFREDKVWDAMLEVRSAVSSKREERQVIIKFSEIP